MSGVCDGASRDELGDVGFDRKKVVGRRGVLTRNGEYVAWRRQHWMWGRHDWGGDIFVFRGRLGPRRLVRKEKG